MLDEQRSERLRLLQENGMLKRLAFSIPVTWEGAKIEYVEQEEVMITESWRRMIGFS